MGKNCKGGWLTSKVRVEEGEVGSLVRSMVGELQVSGRHHARD